MKSLIKILYTILFTIIIILTTNSLAETIQNHNQNNNIINILIDRPDNEDSQYLEKYNRAINDFFSKKNSTHPEEKNFELKFSYCDIEKNFERPSFVVTRFFWEKLRISDESYLKYINCIIKELRNSNYDMMILDERFFFSEISFIENVIIKGAFTFHDLYKFFLNLNTQAVHTNNKDFSHHDKKFLNGGELSNKQFYGIPYELDFDLLYFNDQNKDSSLLKQLLLLEVPTNDTHTSDKDRRTIDQREGRSVLSSNSLNRRDSKGKSITLSATDPSLSIALGDNDELLKLFLEYVGHQFGLPEDNDPDYFKKFYNNKESKSLYPSFQQFLTIKLKLNLNQTLTITPKKAIEAFIHNEKMTLKGKASYYHNLKEVLPKTILLGKALPPDQTSIINTKYLVINNKSLKDKRGLVELAKALTSPEIQNYRADTFGSIPTFDMKQKNSDPVIRTYCQTHKELCEMIEHLIPFHLQKMITQDKYSSSVMEARFVLPNAIRIFLQKNTEAPIMDAYSSIMEVKGLGVDGIHFIQLAIIIIVIIAILFLLFIMTMVYKNRMHPYLKAISPGLCILIILGLILNLIDPIYGSLLRSIILCKIEFVHKIISHTLTIFPMYTIVYRIHYIFTNTSKVNISKKFNDHFLIRLTIISLFVIFIVSIVIAYEITFTLVTLGNLQDFRSIYCFNTIYFIYYPIVALFYIFMVLFNYYYFLLLNNFIKKKKKKKKNK